MSYCIAFAAPPAARSPRKPGRPRVEPDRAERLRRIKAVALLLGRQYKARGVALLAGVSRATLFTWRQDVLDSYTDPEADALRHHFGGRKCS